MDWTLGSINYLCFTFYLCDALRFFQDKGLMAVYHDRYPDFREEVRELLVTRPVSVFIHSPSVVVTVLTGLLPFTALSFHPPMSLQLAPPAWWIHF